MRYATLLGWLVMVLFLVAACGEVESTPTATQKSPGASGQTQRMPTPTATPSPKLPGSITPVPASERYKLDLGDGVVVAFVEGLSPEFEGKVAYLTHVPSGSQLVLDRDGQVIDRHDGRDDGPDRLDAFLSDQATVERILYGLQGDEDLRPRESAADWVHSIQFGGITYLAKGSLGGPIITEGKRALIIEDLGPELYRVAYRIDGYGGHAHQDGDATYLNPGTPVYAAKGYAQEFRLAILEDGGVRLFEADTNPLAKKGEDLLDIRGKVAAIDILSTGGSIRVLGTKEENEEDAVLGTIEGERTVERFVETVLESPVDQESRDRQGPRYFLDFRLADGTSAVRAFWLESGELSRGIMTDAVVTLFVWSALGKENRPSADDAGPKISEGLAARLGLAYLSFAVPEIVVTGKPHSPVVRLMLRSEYQAMKGSVPTADSDSFVWLVEAQGSWRDGGIVPKDKRRDYSIGLVALDADGGRRYGGSYGNSSLLPGRSQTQRTPTPTATPGRAESSGTELPESVQQALGAQPSPDWILVNVPGCPSQPGFSLQVPPDWRVLQKQGIDSYVGEVLGDGVRLEFDYGRFMWSLNPADDPEHEYAVIYEDIGGVEGKLLVPIDASGGVTGVYFARLDGPSLNLIGHDLTREQQRTAVAIFRSIRSGTVAGEASIEELSLVRPSPTPEPMLPGGTSTPPEHIRLDLDNGVVVAFPDDPDRGRIAYVTHVPTGAQAVLDRKGKVLEWHDSPVVDGDLLDATLRDSDSMKRIRRGLGYQGVLIRDPVTTWIDGIHFGGISFRPAAQGGDGVSTEKMELDESDLGPVVYRVAFCLSCNIELPMGYQVQNGDATLLDPGTPIHSVDGFDPSERLAAIEDGKVLLYDKFVPTPPTETPTPVATPSSGTSQPLDHQARDAKRLREVMEEFPERMKTWIDQDTIVYLLRRHPHGSKGDLIAVALYLPTRTVKNYELAIDGNGEASIALYSERTPDSPEGRAASLRLEQDPRVAAAALHLLTTVKRWSKK